MNRRGFLTGLGVTLIAAPAIVRAASLMPVRGIVMPTEPMSLMSNMVRLQEELSLRKSRMIYTLMHPSAYRALLEVDAEMRPVGYGQIIQQEPIPELADWQTGHPFSMPDA